MFDTFGIDVELEAVYQQLLVTPDGTTEILAALSEIVPVELDRHLAELVDIGVVRRSSSASGFTALPPHHAYEVLLEREEARLDAERARLREARTAIPELVDDYVARRRVGVGEQVEWLDDSLLVRSRIYQLSQTMTTSVWATHPGPALPEEAVAAALPLEREANRPELDRRMLLSLESLGPPHWMTYLNELVSMGHLLRTMPAIPQMLLIFDGRHALLPAPGRDGSTGAYVLHGGPLVRPLTALYDELWNSGLPYGQGTDVQREDVFDDARMKQVALLLSRGLKDDAVARRLGISVRTVRRIIAAISTRLGAESRFQAGYLAATSPWFDEEATGPTTGI